MKELDEKEDDDFRRYKLSKNEKKFLKKQDAKEDDFGNIGREFRNYNHLMKQDKNSELNEHFKIKSFNQKAFSGNKRERNKSNAKRGRGGGNFANKKRKF